jgi:hypothetical protein
VTIQAQIEVLESLAAIDAELKVLSDALSQEREALDGKRTHLAELDARLARTGCDRGRRHLAARRRRKRARPEDGSAKFADRQDPARALPPLRAGEEAQGHGARLDARRNVQRLSHAPPADAVSKAHARRRIRAVPQLQSHTLLPQGCAGRRRQRRRRGHAVEWAVSERGRRCHAPPREISAR